jgi:hypothetical protein
MSHIHTCFDKAVGFIATNIIHRCRTDMTKTISETGKPSADLSKEEQTCEATGGANAVKPMLNVQSC